MRRPVDVEESVDSVVDCDGKPQRYPEQERVIPEDQGVGQAQEVGELVASFNDDLAAWEVERAVRRVNILEVAVQFAVVDEGPAGSR